MINSLKKPWLKRFITSMRSKVLHLRTAHLVTLMSIAECSEFLTTSLDQQGLDTRYQLNGIISKQDSDRVEGEVCAYYTQDKERLNCHAAIRIEITAANFNQCDVHITTTLGSYYAIELIMAVILVIGNILVITRLPTVDLLGVPGSSAAPVDTAALLILSFLMCLPAMGFLVVVSVIAIRIRGRRAQDFLMAFYVEGLQATVGT